MPSFPPFAGFPPAASRFLHDLEANNDRDWFQAHKQAYLDAIVAPAQSFVVALGERLRKGRRNEIGGLTYARVPRGFDADHPRARWLLHDGLWATRGFEGTRILHSPAFVDRCFELCRELAPLHRWLVKVDRRTHARR